MLFVIIGMLVLVGPLVVGLVISTAKRARPKDQQRREFAAKFNGQPVYFHFYYWSISQDEARAIAAQYGYVEGPRYRRMLTFYPAPGWQPPYAPGVPYGPPGW